MTEIEDWELWATCIHEAGHFVIAQTVYGTPAIAFVGPGLTRRWYGLVHSFPDTRYKRQGKWGRYARRMVGLAGSVSEAIYWADEIDDAVLHAQAATLSPTDAETAGFCARRHWVECIRLARANWPAILTAAQQLYEEVRRLGKASLGQPERIRELPLT